MRSLLPIAAAALVAAAPAAGPQDARFRAIWQEEWKWRVSQGIAEGDGQKVDATLPDVSAAAHARWQAKWAETMRRLDAIDERRLSPDVRIDFQVYRAQLAAYLEEEKWREWEKPLNGDSAFWADIQYGARQSFRGGEADYRAYLSQMRAIPRWFDQNVANMRAGLARGFMPPKIIMGGRDKAVASIAEARDPTETVYYEPFAKLPATIPAATRTALQAEAKQVIARDLIPAHRKLLAFLRETYLPATTETLGASGYKDGAAYYQSRIRNFTTLDLTADQIHQIGLAEIAKIRAEMEAVKRDTGYTGDLKSFLDFLRTDKRFYPTSGDQLLREAAWHAKRFDGMASKWFGRLPRGRFQVIPVPPDIAPYYTAGRGGLTAYLVNTYNLPSRPLFQLQALTLHESAPGHSWQGWLAAENIALPPFRRNSYISAFGEGWALYTERLGDEMGFYETKYDRFGMLSYQAWRAARLVIDTGIHAKGWSREQAQQYFRDNTALSDHEIMTEVDRYIGWPGQALSYYLGQLSIQKSRAKAEAALGARFDVRNFHDTVLSMGSVPLPVLEARIDRFIAEGGPSPYPKEE